MNNKLGGQLSPPTASFVTEKDNLVISLYIVHESKKGGHFTF